jgi:hypothetical protein
MRATHRYGMVQHLYKVPMMFSGMDIWHFFSRFRIFILFNVTEVTKILLGHSFMDIVT